MLLATVLAINHFLQANFEIAPYSIHRFLPNSFPVSTQDHVPCTFDAP